MRLIDKISAKKLRELYWQRKMSSSEIAKIYKCWHSTICRRLRECGIKTRTRSEVNKVRFNINIPKKELKNLYLKRELSSPEIAKIYHCSPGTIRRKLREYGIKIRAKSEAKKLFYNINIPKKELKELYLEKKLSSVNIAKKFKCNPGLIRNRLREYKLPVRHHYEAHLLCNQPRYERCDFNGSLEEKAYLIGFRKGDLYVTQARPRTIVVSMASTKSAQIELFENLFSKYGHIWKGRRVWKSKFGTYYREVSICCYLNNTFEFLLDKKDLIEPWILENKKYFAAFLGGYSDAEGSFCIYNKRDGNFSIRSQDKNILHQIRAKSIELGILCRYPQIARKKGTKDIRGTISNENIWGLWVYRKDALLKLIKLVNPYSKHADKRKSMEIVKNNVLKRNEMYNNQQDRKYYKLYLEEGVKI